MFKEYGNYDGLGLAALIKKGEVSASEVLDEAIARTEAIDPKINAVVVRHDDYARGQIQRGLPDGPFTGTISPARAPPQAPAFMPISSRKPTTPSPSAF